VGSIFDRSGVAQRLVNFAVAIIGRGPGMLPVVAIMVAMFLGGISGSGPANAAAVGGVMIAAMARAGYPSAFSASVIGAAAATDILIPPSIALIVYSVLVPGASVPALFAAGMVPGILAMLGYIVVVALTVHFKPDLAPATAKSTGREKWAALGGVWPIALVFAVVFGGIYGGFFTPTEGAGVGAAGLAGAGNSPDPHHLSDAATGPAVSGVVDFHAAAIDTPATDLARLLGSWLPPVAGQAAPLLDAWQEPLAAYDRLRPLAAVERRLVPWLDATAVILGLDNWFRWTLDEQRQFPDPTRVQGRIDRLLRRLEGAIDQALHATADFD
jgi:hypothetical protein